MPDALTVITNDDTHSTVLHAKSKEALRLNNEINFIKKKLSTLNGEYKTLLQECEDIMSKQNIDKMVIDEDNEIIIKTKSSIKALSKDFLEKYLQEFCAHKVKGVDPDKLSKMMVEFLMKARNNDKKKSQCVCIKQNNHKRTENKSKNKKRKINNDIIEINNNDNNMQEDVFVKQQIISTKEITSTDINMNNNNQNIINVDANRNEAVLKALRE